MQHDDGFEELIPALYQINRAQALILEGHRNADRIVERRLSSPSGNIRSDLESIGEGSRPSVKLELTVIRGNANQSFVEGKVSVPQHIYDDLKASVKESVPDMLIEIHAHHIAAMELMDRDGTTYDLDALPPFISGQSATDTSIAKKRAQEILKNFD